MGKSLPFFRFSKKKKKSLPFFRTLPFQTCFNEGTISLGVVEVRFRNLTLLSPLSSMLVVWFTFQLVISGNKKWRRQSWMLKLKSIALSLMTITREGWNFKKLKTIWYITVAGVLNFSPMVLDYSNMFALIVGGTSARKIERNGRLKETRRISSTENLTS